MEPIKRLSLCPGCEACPEVMIEQERGEVRIGEEGNLVRLNKQAWNTLVKAVREGELTSI